MIAVGGGGFPVGVAMKQNHSSKRHFCRIGSQVSDLMEEEYVKRKLGKAWGDNL